MLPSKDDRRNRFQRRKAKNLNDQKYGRGEPRRPTEQYNRRASSMLLARAAQLIG